MAEGLRIVKGLPPNYVAILKVFGDAAARPGVVYTYGDTCYNPSGWYIPYPLRCHEEVHVRQQAEIGAADWWRRYLTDTAFRLAQEVEAHAAEYRAMSRPDRQKWIGVLVRRLCGPLYGNLVSAKEARRLIRDGAVTQRG